ncbi:MAG: WXG100 family type VII secretion target [Clostridia bacterium]|nr:WXG100 family type VII secretion target [Clostridia bacterium]
MSKLTVTVEELRSAAAQLENLVAEFESISGNAHAAGDALAGEWEGEAQVAFVEEQTRAKQWYDRTCNIMRVYIAALKTAATMYEMADMAAKAVIG